MKAFISNVTVQEYFVEGRDAEASQVLVHITEPANESEYERGYLFMLCEGNGASPKTLQLLNRWVEEIETGFYDEPVRGNTAAAHFERLLERINRKSVPLLKEMTQEAQELHIIIGFVNDHTMSFATRGEPEGYVVYRDKQGNTNAIDILASNRSADDDNQLFSDIVTGDIHKGDILFFSTPHIADAFNGSHITTILTSKEPRKALHHFQNVLEGLDNGFSFGGIMIERNAIDEQAPEILQKKSKPHESLEDLLTTQRETEETLSPSLLGKLKRSLEERLEKKPTSTDEDPDLTPSARLVKPTPHRELVSGVLHIGGRTFWRAGKNIGVYGWQALRTTVITIVMLFETLFYVITNAGGRRQEFLDHWRRRMSDSWDRLRDWFDARSLMQRISTIAAVVFLIGFLGSILVMRHNRNEEIEDAAYRASVTTIEEKIAAAQSALIYKEEDRVRILLSEVTAAMQALPQGNTNERKTVTDLTNRLSGIKEEIRHAQHIQAAQLLDVGTSGLTDARSLLLTTGLLLVSDTSGKLLSLERGTQKLAIEEHVPSFSPFVPAATDEGLVFFVNQQKALQWKYTADDASYAVAIPGNGALKDALVYNDRLYALVPEQKQIFKFGRHQENFAAPTPWIKGNTDIGNAVDFTIDGSIWILLNNGVVKVFERGQEKPFTLATPDPGLTNPTAIWTKVDSNWLYVLEPSTKRLVVFDKSGALKTQYVFDDATDLRSFAVDETKKQIYLLDGTTVRQFVPTHL